MQAVYASSSWKQYMQAVHAAFGLMDGLICLVPAKQLLAVVGCLLKGLTAAAAQQQFQPPPAAAVSISEHHGIGR
jgi:hypothetical protein